MHPPFFKIMDEIQTGLRYLFQTNSKYTLLVSGTGHAGASQGAAMGVSCIAGRLIVNAHLCVFLTILATHAGMEATIANLVEPGETVVVGNKGIWGERVVDMAGRFGGAHP